MVVGKMILNARHEVMINRQRRRGKEFNGLLMPREAGGRDLNKAVRCRHGSTLFRLAASLDVLSMSAKKTVTAAIVGCDLSPTLAANS